MQKWEYWANVFIANPDRKSDQDVRDAFGAPDDWKVEKYSPLRVAAQFNDLGKNGWELVHMEPIHSWGKNDDIGFSTGGGGNMHVTHWSNFYFAVFKRPIEN